MPKKKESRLFIIMEHRCVQTGNFYRYQTSKNKKNTPNRISLRKYSPMTGKHELFLEIK